MVGLFELLALSRGLLGELKRAGSDLSGGSKRV